MITKILILGASGLLGNNLLDFFSKKKDLDVYGSIRKKSYISDFTKKYKLFFDIDAEDKASLSKLFEKTKPNVVINCIGITKQTKEASNNLKVISLNSLLPHYLANLSSAYRARLIHISTDCIFSGSKGNYLEKDYPDALDLYGRSKFLGEVTYPNTVTLRTSIIGHEIDSAKSLINWFLSQDKNIKGFKKAIFSGLPTYEIARIIYKYVLPNSNLEGLYHLSADPINKYELLLMVRDVYGKKIKIFPDETLVIDRSLNSSSFRKITGFSPKPWLVMIKEMYNFK
tara:strand:- start:9363 stop:10217 length:855 start_codon:yes stop_codon:yes gene_type:complete